ncbi:FAD-dependent oxidoreductase [Salipiger abyssi]|uniref:FAD-dependent oxidoreductase n=2 Tax=Salipiger abyssi TaxID=1250539 RepID=UPI004058A4C5
MSDHAPTPDTQTDVAVIGAGPAGLAAAVAAASAGASVTVIELCDDIGGRGIVSGGNIHLGGGNALQARLGIEDTPDAVFADWVRHDLPESRFCDRDLVRAYADHSVETYEFLAEHGVRFIDTPTAVKLDVKSVGPQSVPRVFRCEEWPVAEELALRESGRNGSGLVRALERSARRLGVVFRLGHRMTRIAPGPEGQPQIVEGTAPDGAFAITARRGIVLATGGSTGNVNFRRIFDPRLTEEYQQVGAPVAPQTGDGEIAAMAYGASLWGTAAQTAGTCLVMAKTHHIGCRWGYKRLKYRTDSPHFPRAGATGLTVSDWQNVILVNQAGKRFWNEEEEDQAFFDAAMGYCRREGAPDGGGPIWAIFDADAVAREGWTPEPPHVDPQYFARGDTLSELVANLDNPYQSAPLDRAALAETVARYNCFVAEGVDRDFGKPQPRYPIARPPFYAAWATPMIHDSLAGLRIDGGARVIGLDGAPIPGLFCAGESHGGFPQHGLGRSVLFGRLAGLGAARREG